MASTTRIGVFGYGYWGPNLVRNLVDIPSCEVVAVADLSPIRLQQLRGCYPHIWTTGNHRDLFELNLDAVVIATPPATHYSLAKEALQHGLHVLVEKPLALSSDHAESLIELAHQKQRVLMVGHTFIYNPAVCALKQIIQSGELGDILYIDAARLSLGLFQRDLNVVWDLAPHDISIVMDLLGSEPRRVSARGTACVLDGVEDVAYLTMEFPNKVLTHVHVSWLDPCKVRRITVVGSRKMVVYDDVEAVEKLRIYDKGVERPCYSDTFAQFQFSYRYGDITIPYIKFTEPLRLECQHFVECIVTGQSPRTDGIAGLKVVRIIEAAQRSLKDSGHFEEIPDLRAGEEKHPSGVLMAEVSARTAA